MNHGLPPKTIISALLIAAAAACALGVHRVAQKQEAARLGYELSKANRELRRFREQERRLRLERVGNDRTGQS